MNAPLTQEAQDLLNAYHCAPRYVQNYVQLVAFFNAGKTPCPLMCQQLELLAALIVANDGDADWREATSAYIPKPGPLPKDASERRARRQAWADSFQAPSEIPPSHPDAEHLGATAPASEDAQ